MLQSVILWLSFWEIGYMPIVTISKKNIAVKMRARTTSQIDWWHARLTVVSLDGHDPGCQSISLF
jgi:hypothetical protein